jgi:selenide,water dikinase
VFTTDFFTPMADDPYTFGRIAAANALSDIYAMGGEPKMALNLLALDPCVGIEVADEILRGGADAVREAGAVIAGGHSIEDAEPKYGLAVFGTVHPQRIVRNSGARPGDLLYLTKPLGTGIMHSAFLAGEESTESMQPVVSSMSELNAGASEAMKAAAVHAATDVTGYGLAGHLHEMLMASTCSASITGDELPLFCGVKEHAAHFAATGKVSRIIEFVEEYVHKGSWLDDEFKLLMRVICDPQTSGGLLIALCAENRSIFEESFKAHYNRSIAPIGVITEGSPGHIHLC